MLSKGWKDVRVAGAMEKVAMVFGDSTLHSQDPLNPFLAKTDTRPANG